MTRMQGCSAKDVGVQRVTPGVVVCFHSPSCETQRSKTPVGGRSKLWAPLGPLNYKLSGIYYTELRPLAKVRILAVS